MKLKNIDLFSVAAGLLFVLLLFLLSQDLGKLNSVRQELERVEIRIKMEEQRSQALKKELSYGSARAMELAAREKMGLIMPGETAYKIIWGR